ncbi:MAG: hypothetical protein NTV01_20310, partial [Bacteroidia bacterium]|nr:hypothetical protein [Bacteroidia bacterium]
IRVVSRTTTEHFRGSILTSPEIAKKLNVNYVLEGSVRKAGNNLRITAQLIDGVNDTHLWAEKYSGTLDDIFDIQEKLSRSIVNSIKLKLHPDQNQKIAKRLLENVQAYDYYLKARRELWLWTEEALERALQYFQNALKITGENALLLIGIGEVYAHYYHAGFRMNEETLEKAEDYANKGMALDSDSSRAYYLLGLIEHARGNLRTAYKYHRHSLSLNPNELDCIFNFVYLLSMVFGKPDAAAHWARRAFEIDPLSPMNNMLLGWVDWMQERFELAYESIQKWYKIESNSEIAKGYFINILIWNKRWEEAFALIDRWIDLEPRNFLALTFLFLKYALKGEKNKALQLIKEDWRNLAWLDYHLPWNLAQGYAVLEEPEAALEWLENIINKGWCNYPLFSQSDPFLSKIREEERFKKLMERVKYEWENFEV